MLLLHPRRAAELKYGTLLELQKQLKAAEDALAKKRDGARLLKEEVTEEDIAEVISKWTGGCGGYAPTCSILEVLYAA